MTDPNGERRHAPRRVGAFVTKDGHGMCVFVREGDEDESYSLTIPEAQATVDEVVRSLRVAQHRRDQGEWPKGDDACKHASTLKGRIEHALFYAMRDEFGEDEIDEYVSDYADSILRELGLYDNGGTEA